MRKMPTINFWLTNTHTYTRERKREGNALVENESHPTQVTLELQVSLVPCWAVSPRAGDLVLLTLRVADAEAIPLKPSPLITKAALWPQ